MLSSFSLHLNCSRRNPPFSLVSLVCVWTTNQPYRNRCHLDCKLDELAATSNFEICKSDNRSHFCVQLKQLDFSLTLCTIFEQSSSWKLPEIGPEFIVNSSLTLLGERFAKAWTNRKLWHFPNEEVSILDRLSPCYLVLRARDESASLRWLQSGRLRSSHFESFDTAMFAITVSLK